MQSKKIVIKNETGLHARPAALFVQTAGKFISNIKVKKDSKEADAKSIMGIMALGVSKGDEIEIITRGEDEKEALEALVDLLLSLIHI